MAWTELVPQKPDPMEVPKTLASELEHAAGRIHRYYRMHVDGSLPVWLLESNVKAELEKAFADGQRAAQRHERTN